MTRKHWTLLALALVLGAFSLYLNKDWFSRGDIHIYHRSRPARAAMARGRQARDDNPAINSILFGFTHRQKLKSIKVVQVSQYETNKYAHAIWHLVSESNSVPVKDFTYGSSIQGMHAAIRGALPDLLEPGVKYRMFVEIGSRTFEHDFVPDPRTQ